MTTDQVIAETKTVTRRFGWVFLDPGDRIRPVRKSMGLKKGEKIEPLLPAGRCIEVVSTRWEPLNAITKHECFLEGFPHLGPSQFVWMIISHYGCRADKLINRIVFKYVDESGG